MAFPMVSEPSQNTGKAEGVFGARFESVARIRNPEGFCMVSECGQSQVKTGKVFSVRFEYVVKVRNP